jgi:hypothetical protein
MARLSEEYVGIWGRGFGDGAAGNGAFADAAVGDPAGAGGRVGDGAVANVVVGDGAGASGIAGDGAFADGAAGDGAGAGGIAGDGAFADGAAGDGAGAGGSIGILRGLDPGSPKISRGENYRGLPWVMLDYPRAFGREDVLAIRTMFWWGHGFNVTLHLKGRWMDVCLPVIVRRREDLAAAGFHIGINDDEWRLEHGPENYLSLGEAGEALAGGRAFLKLSAAVGLDRWAEAPTIMKMLFGVLVDVLGKQVNSR